MSLYRPKGQEVEAWQHDGSRASAERLIRQRGHGEIEWAGGLTDVKLNALGGEVLVCPGDWLVLSEVGFRVYVEEEFRACFEPVEAGLRAAA